MCVDPFHFIPFTFLINGFIIISLRENVAGIFCDREHDSTKLFAVDKYRENHSVKYTFNSELMHLFGIVCSEKT